MDRSSGAVAMNDRGQVVGNVQDVDGYMDAFVWQEGNRTDLGTLTGGYELTRSGSTSAGRLLEAVTTWM